MKVGVVYAESDKQVWLNVDLPDGSTVEEAINKSGILHKFPYLNIKDQKVGIFGRFAKLDAPLKDGDRVEIYRPITADPLTVKRRDTEDDDQT